MSLRQAAQWSPAFQVLWDTVSGEQRLKHHQLCQHQLSHEVLPPDPLFTRSSLFVPALRPSGLTGTLAGLGAAPAQPGHGGGREKPSQMHHPLQVTPVRPESTQEVHPSVEQSICQCRGSASSPLCRQDISHREKSLCQPETGSSWGCKPGHCLCLSPQGPSASPQSQAQFPSLLARLLPARGSQTLPARLISTRAGHQEPTDGKSSTAQGMSMGLGEPRKRSLVFVPGQCPSDTQQGSQKTMDPASNEVKQLTVVLPHIRALRAGRHVGSPWIHCLKHTLEEKLSFSSKK